MSHSALISSVSDKPRYADMYGPEGVPGDIRLAVEAFIEDVEDNACAVINTLTFLSRKAGDDVSVRSSILAGPCRLKSHSLARHFVWFTLFYHPVTAGFVNKTGLGREYNRDHKTVGYGIRSVAGLIFPKATHAHGRAYEAFAQTICEYGEFDFRSAARIEIMARS